MISPTPATGTDVAVCVVLYQSRPRLPALIASLRAQTKVLCPWIFCIQGPDDGSVEFLEALDESPLVLHSENNSGYAGGMNSALAQVQTPFVLLLTHDVALNPDFVATALQAMDPDVALVGGKLVQTGSSKPRIDSAGLRWQPWFRYVDRGHGVDAVEFDTRAEVPGLCGAVLLARRTALLEAAFEGEVFDVDYFMYKEDQDLGLRLRAAGYRLMYEPQAVANHERGFRYGARAAVSLALRRRSLANRYLLILSHWRVSEHLVTLPLLVIFEVFAFFSILVLEPRTLAAWPEVIRGAPKAWRKRRFLSELRRRKSPE